VVATVGGLTRTRLAQAAQAVASCRGGSADDVVALYERTNAVVAAALSPHDAARVKGAVGLAGVQVQVFDTAAVLPCPPALTVDELTWDEGGLRLRTPLGVHAVPWGHLELALAAVLNDGPPAEGARREADAISLVDLVTKRWERFRIAVSQGPAAGASRDPHLSPPRLAGAVLDRRADLRRNEAFTALSIGKTADAPRFSDLVDHEAWSALWLASSRLP
jgi:hypothetical protein